MLLRSAVFVLPAFLSVADAAAQTRKPGGTITTVYLNENDGDTCWSEWSTTSCSLYGNTKTRQKISNTTIMQNPCVGANFESFFCVNETDIGSRKSPAAVKFIGCYKNPADAMFLNGSPFTLEECQRFAKFRNDAFFALVNYTTCLSSNVPLFHGKFSEDGKNLTANYSAPDISSCTFGENGKKSADGSLYAGGINVSAVYRVNSSINDGQGVAKSTKDYFFVGCYKRYSGNPMVYAPSISSLKDCEKKAKQNKHNFFAFELDKCFTSEKRLLSTQSALVSECQYNNTRTGNKLDYILAGKTGFLAVYRTNISPSSFGEGGLSGYSRLADNSTRTQLKK